MQLLFTAGMTLIDSVDSIVMLYSYSGFPDRKLALLEDTPSAETQRLESLDLETPESPMKFLSTSTPVLSAISSPPEVEMSSPDNLQEIRCTGPHARITDSVSLKSSPEGGYPSDRNEDAERQLRVKRNAISGLSIVLTLMSILVAFTYALFHFSRALSEDFAE
jgi:nickel/cobalt transporter (NiCoT) family protein